MTATGSYAFRSNYFARNSGGKDSDFPFTAGAVQANTISDNLISVTFHDCIFEENFAEYSGSAVVAHIATFDNCTFINVSVHI